MNPYIEILRPGNALMGAISIILIAIIDRTLSIPIILAMIAVFFETAAGNVINDYFDYNIDLINKPERPIPSGRISLKNGRNYAYLLFLAGTVCGFLISYLTNNWIPFAIVLIADVILYLYAYKLKSTPVIGNLAVGFMTGFGFVFGGFSLNNPSIIVTSIYLGFFAFVMTTAREIIKDIDSAIMVAESEFKGIKEGNRNEVAESLLNVHIRLLKGMKDDISILYTQIDDTILDIKHNRI